MARFSDDALRGYLLGTLPEAEMEAVEDEYFASRDVFERLRGVEDDLVDDCAAGRLSPVERQQLERRWADSERQRERLRIAQALRSATGAASVAPTPRSAPARPWLRFGLAPLRLAALVLLSLGIVQAWRAGWPRARPAASSASEGVRAPARSSTTEPEARPSPSAPKPGTLVVWALSPLAPRAGPGAPPLRVPRGTHTVRLELEGEPESLRAAGSAPLAVELATVEGRRVWAGPAARPGPARPGLLATIELPAAWLAPDDYVVSLSLARDGSTLERYFVNVRR